MYLGQLNSQITALTRAFVHIWVNRTDSPRITPANSCN